MISLWLNSSEKMDSFLRGQGEPPLHLVIGALRFSPETSQSIEDLIAQADRLRGGGASLSKP